MTAPGPRPDVRLLAELDAGLLDEARARAVRAAVAADPAAQAILHALAATRAELAALPDPPVPPALAARWSAALAAEQSALRAETAPPADADPSPATPEAESHPSTAAEPSISHRERALHTPQPPSDADGSVRGPHTRPADAPAAPPRVAADLSTPPPAAHDAGPATPPPNGRPADAPDPPPPAAAPRAAPTSAGQHPTDPACPPPAAGHADRGQQTRREHRAPGHRRVRPVLRGGPLATGRGRRPHERGPGSADPDPCDTPDGRVRREDSSPPARRRWSAGARLLRRPAVLATVLLVAVATAAGLHGRREAPPPTIGRPQLAAEAVTAVGVRDTAGLDDPSRRAACLRAVGGPAIDPAAPLLGGRRVMFEDEPGVLLVLGTGQRGTFDVLIVDPDCGPGGGRLLAAVHVAPS